MAYDGFDLSGKVAVITGGNGGIGLGFARAIAAAGADVSIWGTNADKNAVAEEELKGMDKLIRDTVSEAVEFAQKSEEPDPSELYTDVLIQV